MRGRKPPAFGRGRPGYTVTTKDGPDAPQVTPQTVPRNMLVRPFAPPKMANVRGDRPEGFDASS